MTISTDKALKTWLQAYHDSVGGGADECLKLYGSLHEGKLANGTNLLLLKELLEVMSALSPDPQTVSCAILFVASEYEEDLEAIRVDISHEVRDQL
ncbi:MAG: hypothetical protein OEU84_14565, partial [Xanthomonadales bacterium]|nr:hypothetical protein [Xanthomonadales bacterium]